VQEEIEIMLPI